MIKAIGVSLPTGRKRAGGERDRMVLNMAPISSDSMLSLGPGVFTLASVLSSVGLDWRLQIEKKRGNLYVQGLGYTSCVTSLRGFRWRLLLRPRK